MRVWCHVSTILAVATHSQAALICLSSLSLMLISSRWTMEPFMPGKYNSSRRIITDPLTPSSVCTRNKTYSKRNMGSNLHVSLAGSSNAPSPEIRLGLGDLTGQECGRGSFPRVSCWSSRVTVLVWIVLRPWFGLWVYSLCQLPAAPLWA